jgi:hypothetical protein
VNASCIPGLVPYVLPCMSSQLTIHPLSNIIDPCLIPSCTHLCSALWPDFVFGISVVPGRFLCVFPHAPRIPFVKVRVEYYSVALVLVFPSVSGPSNPPNLPPRLLQPPRQIPPLMLLLDIIMQLQQLLCSRKIRIVFFRNWQRLVGCVWARGYKG